MCVAALCWIFFAAPRQVKYQEEGEAGLRRRSDHTDRTWETRIGASQPVGKLLCEARKSRRGWDTTEGRGDCCARSSEVSHATAQLPGAQEKAPPGGPAFTAPFSPKDVSSPHPGPDTISKWGHEVRHTRTHRTRS